MHINAYCIFICIFDRSEHICCIFDRSEHIRIFFCMFVHISEIIIKSGAANMSNARTNVHAIPDGGWIVNVNVSPPDKE